MGRAHMLLWFKNRLAHQSNNCMVAGRIQVLTFTRARSVYLHLTLFPCPVRSTMLSAAEVCARPVVMGADERRHGDHYC